MAATYHINGELSSIDASRLEPDVDKQPAFFAIVRCDAHKSLRHLCKDVHQPRHELELVPRLVHARSGAIRRRNNVIQFRREHVYATVDWTESAGILSWVREFAPRDGLKLYQDLILRLRLMGPLLGYMLLALLALLGIAIIVRSFPIVNLGREGKGSKVSSKMGTKSHCVVA